jgi:hypothetical protein
MGWRVKSIKIKEPLGTAENNIIATESSNYYDLKRINPEQINSDQKCYKQ